MGAREKGIGREMKKAFNTNPLTMTNEEFERLYKAVHQGHNHLMKHLKGEDGESSIRDQNETGPLQIETGPGTDMGRTGE